MKHFLFALLPVLLLSLTVQCVQGQSKEVFGFTKFVNENIYKQYDLKKLTVLVFLDDNFDEKFLKYAKENDVRTYLQGIFLF